MSDRATGLLFLLGALLIALGFGLVWLPLGAIATGVLLLLMAAAAARAAAKARAS